MTEERVRWRMTLVELCHLVRASPQTLEEWARLGALGPRWKETTEGKWRHITRAAARRAVVMRAMLDSNLEPEQAAEVADRITDGLAKGQSQEVELSSVVKLYVHPEDIDLP